MGREKVEEKRGIEWMRDRKGRRYEKEKDVYYDISSFFSVFPSFQYDDLNSLVFWTQMSQSDDGLEQRGANITRKMLHVIETFLYFVIE